MSEAAYATITSVAQSIGIPHVKESIASKLAHAVQRDLLKIISDSLQILSATHGARLRPTHINAALEANFLDPLFGYPEGRSYNLVRAGTVDALDLLVVDDRQVPIDANARLDLVYPIDISYDFEWSFVVGRSARAEEDDLYDQAYVEKVDVKSGMTRMIQRERMEDIVGSSSKHVFSYELQLYHHMSRKHLLSGDPRKREKMLLDLRQETCLETLLPYYLQFCFSLIRNYPNQFDKLYVSVSVARALAQNDDLSVDIYLDKMISLAETFLLSPKVGSKALHERFLLQDYAADLLKLLLDKSVAHYPNVEPTVASELLSVLRDPQKTLGQKYGALVGLTASGLTATSSFLLQVLPMLVTEVAADKIEGAPRSIARAREGCTRLYGVAVRAAGLCVHSDSYMMTATGRLEYSPKAMPNYRAVAEVFGADLLPFWIDDTSVLSL
jgi:transcription initiation factor TFIID subunit 6